MIVCPRRAGSHLSSCVWSLGCVGSEDAEQAAMTLANRPKWMTVTKTWIEETSRPARMLRHGGRVVVIFTIQGRECDFCAHFQARECAPVRSPRRFTRSYPIDDPLFLLSFASHRPCLFPHEYVAFTRTPFVQSALSRGTWGIHATRQGSRQLSEARTNSCGGHCVGGKLLRLFPSSRPPPAPRDIEKLCVRVGMLIMHAQGGIRGDSEILVSQQIDASFSFAFSCRRDACVSRDARKMRP